MALVIAARFGWAAAYAACALFALPAMLVGVVMGEPRRRRPPAPPAGIVEAWSRTSARSWSSCAARRHVVLLFVLIHKIGDTLANLTLRLLFEDLGFTNDEVAFYDVGVGFVALLAGVFVGGAMYASMGMKRSVFVSLVLMAVSNFSFAALAAYGHSNLGMAAAIGFENFASGIGGVAVVAYLSALCNLRFTATQYALLSAARQHRRPLPHRHHGRRAHRDDGLRQLLPADDGDRAARRVPYGYMVRSGLADVSIGTAGREGE